MKIDEVIERYPVLEAPIKRIKAVDGIDELYPPQVTAVENGIIEGKNCTLAIPTAAGKTILAEFTMLHSILKDGGKAIYIVPLKALANQKYREFTEKYQPLGVNVAISTGDFDSSDPWLKKYDLIIATSEKTDSLMRHEAEWLRDLTVVVADEAHLLNSPKRGPTLEITLTRLMKLNSHVTFLLLSATLANAGDLADWIGGELIESDFRPVDLYEGVYYDGTITFKQKEDYHVRDGRRRPVLALAEDTLRKDKQAIVFVATRRSAEAVARRLSRITRRSLEQGEKKKLRTLSDDIYHVLDHPTEQCKKIATYVQNGAAFHHAGLSGGQKLLIENNFRKGLIKFVAATPSLAMGVDLPAFRVILRDSKRYTGHGMDWIPTLEYKQMAGRCVTGDTTLFTRKGTPLKIEEIAKKYFEDKETGRKRIEDRLKVFSVDLENHKPCLSTVTHIWKRKVNKILKIKTKGGKIIKVTPDHLLVSFRKTSSGKPSLAKCSNENWKLYNKTMKLRKKYKIGPNKIVKRLGTPEKYWTIQHWLYEGAKPNRRAFSWEKANNLEVGESLRDTDYIGSILGLKNKGDPPSPQSFLPMEYLVDKGENTFMMKQGHKKCRLPDKWSKKLCKFIAKIMADGNIYYDEESNSYQIRYYNKSERVHERYAKLCKELFEKNVNTKFRRGSYQSAFKSFVVGAFLENIGVPAGKKALILRMPKVIFSLPENMIKSFLREYSRCDGWEDEHSYFFSTGSRGLAYDFILLFSRIGAVGRIRKKPPNDFRDNPPWEIHVTKSQLNDDKKLGSVGHIHPEMIKEITTVDEETYVYDLTLNPHHNFIANGLIIHNSGRPKYDEFGEAILLAKSKSKVEELQERYIEGTAEAIDSKLAVEPVLRMYVLTIMCEGYNTRNQLIDFFADTFYGHLYGSTDALSRQIRRVTNQLTDFEFIQPRRKTYEVTRLGERVSELYIDPLTVHNLIGFLKDAERNECTDFAYLVAICDTIEMEPLPYVRKSERAELNQKMTLRRDELHHVTLERYDYYRLQKAFKLALVFEAWINERGEDQIYDHFHLTPGGLFSKLSIADWLLYASSELCKLLDLKKARNDVHKLRVRVKHGVKATLIDLVQIKGIGRVRARKLYKHGIKTVETLKETDLPRLQRILGPQLGKNIKERVRKLSS